MLGEWLVILAIALVVFGPVLLKARKISDRDQPSDSRPRSVGGGVIDAAKAGALYFGIVFGVGFVLGPIRIFWAVPRYGERMAELMEMPFMFVAIVLAARWTVRRCRVPSSAPPLVAVGVTALCLLLTAEVGLVLGLRGLSVSEYVASRDPVSGGVYVVMLGLFATMPLLVGRRRA
jgi:hypothetical protein